MRTGTGVNRAVLHGVLSALFAVAIVFGPVWALPSARSASGSNGASEQSTSASVPSQESKDKQKDARPKTDTAPKPDTAPKS
ncbi:MAG: hypothetical protein JOZ87_00025, partial [Chloroflexi bacterium]|nr:hypothetical protein [Chloroflexota bacterium]